VRFVFGGQKLDACAGGFQAFGERFGLQSAIATRGDIANQKRRNVFAAILLQISSRT